MVIEIVTVVLVLAMVVVYLLREELFLRKKDYQKSVAKMESVSQPKVETVLNVGYRDLAANRCDHCGHIHNDHEEEKRLDLLGEQVKKDLSGLVDDEDEFSPPPYISGPRHTIPLYTNELQRIDRNVQRAFDIHNKDMERAYEVLERKSMALESTHRARKKFL